MSKLIVCGAAARFTLAFILALAATRCQAFETTGALFEFDASQDVGGDAVWSETGLNGTETLTFVGGATPTAAPVSDGALNLLAHSIGADGVSNVYESNLGGSVQSSRRSASFEVWFKPNNLTTANQIIQETAGGSAGTILSLSNNNLEFLVNGDNERTLSTTLANTNWHQVVGVINNVSNNIADDTISLYLNGALIGTSAAAEIDDWAGGNQGGFGSYGGTSHPSGSQIGDTTSGVDFNGNLHLFRYYDLSLTAGQILANYNAVVSPAAEWAVDANGNWGTAANWTSNPAVPGVGALAGGDARLGSVITGSRSVALNVNVNLGGLAMEDADGYTVTAGGGVLTLSGAGELRVTTGNHQIAAPIAGAVGFLKTGNGAVALSGANTFSGTAVIRAGRVSVAANSGLGNAANGIDFRGGTLEITGAALTSLNRSVTMTGAGGLAIADPTATVNVTGAVTGAGTLTKSGEGALRLGNAAAYTGAISVTAGAVVLDSTSSLGTASGSTTIGGATGVVRLDGAGGPLTIGESLILTARAASTAPHLQSLSGSHTITSAIDGRGAGTSTATLENAAAGTTLSINNSTTPAALSDTVDQDVTFQFTGAGNFKIGNENTPGSGKIVGNSVDVLVDLANPASRVTIATAAATTDTTNATGSYWGGATIIRGGGLTVLANPLNGTDGELASASIAVGSGATLDVSSFSTYSLQVVQDPDAVPFNGDEIGQVVSGSGTINTGAGVLAAFEDAVIAPGDTVGTLTVNGNVSINQSQANPNGALRFDLNNTTASGNDRLAVTGSLSLQANGVAGGGQFKLDVTPVNGNLAAGTYTIITRGNAGASTATAADFNVRLINPQGTVLNSRQDNASAVVLNPTSVTVNFSAAQAGAWTGAGGSAWDVGLTNNWSTVDGLFFDLDTVSFGNGPAQTTVNVVGPVTPGGMTFTNTTAIYTFTGGGIEGSGAMTLGAGSRVVLANNGNAFTGAISVGVNGSLTLGDGSTGALNTLGEDNSVSLASGAQLIHNNPAGEVLEGVISGAGAIVNNAGALQLRGNNSYSGATTINGGTVTIANLDAGTPLGSAATGTTVNAGGTLRINGQAATLAEPVALNGGTFAVGGADPAAITATGPVTIGAAGGSIQVDGDTGADGLTIAGNIAGSAGGLLTVRAGSNSTISVTGNISNNGSLVKDLPGTLALIGASSSIAAPIIDVRGGDVDVTATSSGTLALASQTLTGRGAVTGDVSTAGASTIRVGGVAGGSPSVTTGLQLNYDAALDASGDGEWDDASSASGSINLQFAGGAASVVPVSDPTFTALTAAYDIGASGGAIAPGSSNAYFDTTRGQTSGTFEVVFKVANTAAGNEQVLMDIGGAAGVSLVLDNGVLKAAVNGDAANTTTFATGALSTGWHHAVAVIKDVDPADGINDAFTLYVDNAQVATSSALDIDDWAGSNGWGFGGQAGVTLDPNVAAGTLLTPQDYHGQIAVARYYQAEFSAGDVSANFNALQSGPFVDVETLTVSGDLTLNAGSTIEIDVFNATLGSDLLSVGGALAAAGTLDVSLAGSVALGDSFDILDFNSLTGSFATVNLPALGVGLDWDDSALLTTGVLSVVTAGANDADFDNDGDVDGSDFLTWQRNLNNPGSNATGDANGSGFVDGADLTVWRSQFGDPPATTAAASVPEPAAWLLGLGALATLAGTRRGKTFA